MTKYLTHYTSNIGATMVNTSHLNVLLLNAFLRYNLFYSYLFLDMQRPVPVINN